MLVTSYACSWQTFLKDQYIAIMDAAGYRVCWFYYRQCEFRMW